MDGSNSLSDSPKDVIPVKVCSKFEVLDENGKLISSELKRATDDILYSNYVNYTSYDTEFYEEENSQLNKQLVTFCLDLTTRGEDGRLIMPLLWNAKSSHCLGKNLNLAKVILNSNLKKLQKNQANFYLMYNAIKEQEKAGIFERIENLPQFL